MPPKKPLDFATQSVFAVRLVLVLLSIEFGSINMTVAVMMCLVFAAQDKRRLGVNVRAAFDSIGTDVYRVNSCLYAFIGIAVCYIAGYLASFFFSEKNKSPVGLTLWDKPHRVGRQP